FRDCFASARVRRIVPRFDAGESAIPETRAGAPHGAALDVGRTRRGAASRSGSHPCRFVSWAPAGRSYAREVNSGAQRTRWGDALMAPLADRAGISQVTV